FSPSRMYSVATLSKRGLRSGLRLLRYSMRRPGVTHAGTAFWALALISGMAPAAANCRGVETKATRKYAPTRRCMRHHLFPTPHAPAPRALGYPLIVVRALTLMGCRR